MRTYLTYQERQRLYRDYKDYHAGFKKVVLFFGAEAIVMGIGVLIGWLIWR